MDDTPIGNMINVDILIDNTLTDNGLYTKR